MAVSPASAVRQRVVVLRALGLGDFCTAVPAFRALRRAFPDQELVLAAPAWQAPLARLAALDRLIPAQALDALPTRETAPLVGVNLHGRGPQSTRRLLDLAPGRLISFRHPVLPQTDDAPRWREDEHDVMRWCRLLGEHGIGSDSRDLALDRPPIRSNTPQWIVVHPGAAAGSRRWPACRFVDVVRRLVTEGERVVLTGTNDERSIAEEILSGVGRECSGRVLDLCARTTIDELCATVAEARAVISNDTGVGHLSYAYGTPSVVLFGPTSPEQWGPPPGPHLAIWNGQLGDPHAAELDRGLASITPDDVLGALRSLL